MLTKNSTKRPEMKFDIQSIVDSVAKTANGLTGDDAAFAFERLSDELVISANEIEPLGLTRDEQNAVYLQGHQFFSRGQYLDAMKNFTILQREDSTEGRYYSAMAACYHVQKQFAKAACSYYLGYFFNQSDPAPLFHIGKCLLATNHREDAIDALGMFIEEAEKANSCHELQKHAQELIVAVSTILSKEN